MILGVAIIQDGIMYMLPKPKRHRHVIKMMVKKYGFERVTGERGFYNEHDVFISREDALSIALLTGQITESEHPRELFSEDLW